MLKTNGVLNTEDREEEIKQIEVYKSHSKFMKNKVYSSSQMRALFQFRFSEGGGNFTVNL